MARTGRGDFYRLCKPSEGSADPAAELMRRAVTEAEREQRRAELYAQLTERRRKRPAVADRSVRTARKAGRP